MKSASLPRSRAAWLPFLAGTVWLVFLVFPVLGVLDTSHPWWVKALGIALIAAFAVQHAWLFLLNIRGVPMWDRVRPEVVAGLLVLLALGLGIGLIVGMGAIGLTSYIIAAAMFTLPLAWSWAVAVTALALSGLLPLLEGSWDRWAFMMIINCGIIAAAGISRIFAEHAARSLQMDRLSAVVLERERVSRDVHDVLGHSLTVIALKTELAERLIESDPARARAELVEVNELARSAIGEVRATVGGLRVREIGDELQSAREALTAAGIQVRIEGEPGDVDATHRILFAWALREATTNILRHAHASHVDISVARNRISVRDDGAGMGDAAEGHGLQGLRERIADSRGRLTVAGLPSGGTEIEVRM